MIPALDCAGHPTYAGEIFDTRQTQANGAYLSGLCGVPFGGYDASRQPGKHDSTVTDRSPGSGDHTVVSVAELNGNGFNFLSNPVRRRPVITSTFALTRNTPKRITASSASATKTSPALFPVLSIPRTAMAAASSVASRTMLIAVSPPAGRILFRTKLTNEFRLGYNRINSQRNKSTSTRPASTLGFPFRASLTCPEMAACRNLLSATYRKSAAPPSCLRMRFKTATACSTI